MYHFKLNQDRTELVLAEPLNDKIANTDEESVANTILFATGFGGISDIEVSPYDGYMYVVSLGQGKIFKILPTDEDDISTDTIPSIPPAATVPPVTNGEDEGDTEEEDLSQQEDDDDEGNGESGGNQQNQDENDDE